jgi:NADH-quinone oxidoreductase subunit M
MNAMGFPILSLLIFLPLVGALILLFIKKEQVNAIRGVTLFVTVLIFFLSLLLLPYYDGSSADFQLVEKFSWIKSIGATYFLGLDGISLWLVLLTTLLTAVSVLVSWDPITERVKEYMVFMLILETGMLGVFLSLDFFLFYVFWEVMLVPMYFLIGVWGGPRKLYAAIKFFLYTLFGSVLMLLGILAIYFYHYNQTGVLTFDYTQLLSPAMPLGLQWWVFLAFFIGFAIKVPMFPFHTWLPDAHVEAPTAGSIILAGVLLKMGTYGFVRFSLPMLPTATIKFVPFMIVLSVIGIIYGAMVAMVQKDMKKLVAYSSVSHLGFVMLGLFALNMQGIEGGMLQMINHGLSTGALFLLVGVIYDRRHTRMIAEYGGLSKQMPIYAAFFAVIMFSSIGLPGLNGFIGEFLILVGAFKVNMYWAALATTGIVLGAAYMLWMYQRVMFGKLENPANMNLPDLNYKETLALIPIVIFCFWIGVYPAPFLSRIHASVDKIVKQVEVARMESEGTKIVMDINQLKALKGQEAGKVE